MLKKYTIKEWLSLFLKEWILPTSGKAFAIFTIATILFNEIQNSPTTPQLNEEIENLYKTSNSVTFQIFIISSAALLIFSILAKKFSKGDDGLLDKIAKKQRYLAIAINSLLGVILLPLVFAITIFEKSGHPMGQLAILAIIYVLLSAVFHWLSIEDMHPYAGILYVISPLSGISSPDFRHITQTRLEHHISYCKGSGPVSILSETNDNQITLFVPILRVPNTFTPKELDFWTIFIDRIESEWTLNNINYERIISPTIKLPLRAI